MSAPSKESEAQSSRVLRVIAEGTAAAIGDDFFRSLARCAAQALGARYAFAAETISELESRSLAYWEGADFGAGFSYRFPGTPCKRVAEGYVCSTASGLADKYPEDLWLRQISAESYVGVPMKNAQGRTIGHIAVLHTEPMEPSEEDIATLKIFAARGCAELERKQADEQLRAAHEELRRLAEELSARKIAELELQKQQVSDQLAETSKALDASEERFRDLFDEAPIAYVLEGTDTRFVRVNRTAMRILGLKPDQVAGSYGKDFVPDTPEAQERLKHALEAIGSGQGASGVVLELRRRDNGQPIWIQWWTRPDPASGLTRTMFVDITDRVLMERERARLEAQNVYLQEEIRSQHNFVEIVGNSRSLLSVLRQVDQVAPTDATVLIYGETGTGKELIARAIHDRSPRRERPLVKVNCGAISAGLVESELFGHVKGAFTGAIAHRDGRFALADGGTIFLDEVGELPPETQVKLLRVLQEQEFEPIGGSKTIKVDVRVIAATNRDLSAMVRDGKFRSDLFYRLNVVPVTMPPLRERADDIPLLTMFFLDKSARKLGHPIKQVAEETMLRLCQYPWPGNIRELQNVIERAVVLASGSVLLVDESALPGTPSRPLPQPPEPGVTQSSMPPPPPPAKTEGASLEEVERQHIVAVLQQVNWRIEGNGGAAKILNLEPSTLRSRMKKLSIVRRSV
jgi:formate hydrogenlyase transcriptional activator